MRIANALKHRI